ILGAELLIDGRLLRVYVENARGYAHLCRLLSPPLDREETSAKAFARQAQLRFQELEGLTEGLLAVGSDARVAALFPGRFYFDATNGRTDEIASHATRHTQHLPSAAILPVHYAQRSDRWKFDVVQSIRTRTL